MNEKIEIKSALEKEKIDSILSGITNKDELAEKKALLEVLSGLGGGANLAHEIGERIKSIEDKK